MPTDLATLRATFSRAESRPFLPKTYTYGSLLGAGKFFRAYYAEDLTQDPPLPVAIKTILSGTVLAFHLLRCEGVGLELLRDLPGITKLRTHYHNALVLDYIPGPTFAEYCIETPTDLLTLTQRLRVIKEISVTLDHIHARGLIHRDIKLDNIIVGEHGPVLIDFGLVAPIGTRSFQIAGAIDMQSDEFIYGAEHYMTPQHVTGDALDPSSDVYSLGIGAYLALTGTFPREGTISTLITESKNIMAPAQHNSLVDTSLSDLVMTMMEFSPRNRPTAKETAQYLERYI